jgi:hypothetical protein
VISDLRLVWYLSIAAAAIVDMPDDVAVIIDYFLGLGLSTAAASIVVVIG